MKSFEETVSEYLAELRGADRENASHRLIELGPGIIPAVKARFQTERDPSIRAVLVNVAWQTDAAGALPLLKDALDDSEPGVWKEALDGLGTLGGHAALEVVRNARPRASAGKAEWLDEAIKQINEAMTNIADA